MKNIFVCTASNIEAQKHIADTVARPISPERVEKHFVGTDLAEVKKVGAQGGYYAWGAVPGRNNISTWEKMKVGDYVLFYQLGTYTYFSRILFKAQNKSFAMDLWGSLDDGQTWEYMYLLDKPINFVIPVEAAKLGKYLPSTYMGFAKIKDERLSEIANDYGTLDKFFNHYFPNLGLESTELPGFWWVNQGDSFTEDRGKKYIWAPKARQAGEIPFHWENMGKVNKDDIIFNYANGLLQGISIASDKAYDFNNEQSDRWDKSGLRIDIQFFTIEPINREKFISKKENLQIALNGKKGPFDINGSVKQGYLFEFTYEAAKIIREIYNQPFPDPIEKYFLGIDTKENVDKCNELMLLNVKKQIILYGPPGTGKTYYARRVALSLLNSEWGMEPKESQ